MQTSSLDPGSPKPIEDAGKCAYGSNLRLQGTVKRAKRSGFSVTPFFQFPLQLIQERALPGQDFLAGG